MLFHEIYGKYYQTVAKILNTALEKGTVSRREVLDIVSGSAFSESSMYIPHALGSSWFLLRADGSPVLRNPSEMPITLTEKRWLKALLQDPRIRLFGLTDRGLEDVEPLFTQEMFCWFDRYGDADPYEDPCYIQNFRALIQAIGQKRAVCIHYSSAKGTQTYRCIPYRLEYSDKDDKFRLHALQEGKNMILNLSRMDSVEILEPAVFPEELPTQKKTVLILELYDRRNALERAMLHFSHLEKETTQLDADRYRIVLRYEPRDERELLIRILSFGPMVKVLEPESLVTQLRERIQKQKNLRAH